MPSIGEELSVICQGCVIAFLFDMARRTRTRGQGVIIDCGRYHHVYDQALIQDPASNTVCYRYTPGL